MANNSVIVGVIVDDDRVSFIEVCEDYNITEELLLDLLEHGLIPSIDIPNKQLKFNKNMLDRIARACRLTTDLELNAAGVVLALELMDELESMSRELDILKKHVNNSPYAT